MGPMGLIRRLLSAAVLFAMFPGCGDTLPPEADPAEARGLLETALAAWAEGGSPDDLVSAATPARVVDRDWTQGLRLTGYRIEGEGQPLGLNAQFPVELDLVDASGRTLARRVVYLVSAGDPPVITRQDADF